MDFIANKAIEPEDAEWYDQLMGLFPSIPSIKPTQDEKCSVFEAACTPWLQELTDYVMPANDKSLGNTRAAIVCELLGEKPCCISNGDADLQPSH
jgi:hypothetical protein